MPSQKKNSYPLLGILGLALTLPMILVSGPLAGYFISQLLIKHFNTSSLVGPILMGLGLFGSGWQTVLLIKKINRNS